MKLIDNAWQLWFPLDFTYVNKHPSEKREQIVSCLAEGNSLRSTANITKTAKNTVAKLLLDVGRSCQTYQAHHFQGLRFNRTKFQASPSFAATKRPGAAAEQKTADSVNTWTWTVIDVDTNLIPFWRVDTRTAAAALRFTRDLAARLECHVQLSTNEGKHYLTASPEGFGSNLDRGILAKIYGDGTANQPDNFTEHFSCREGGIRTDKPEDSDEMPNVVQPENLPGWTADRLALDSTDRSANPREALEFALSFYFMHYNFCRIRRNLQDTPAMLAGVSTHVWTISEVVALTNQRQRRKI